MAFYLNQFHCIGNLVADPEIKNAGSTKVCKFRIAVNNPHNETALFFYVDVWGKEGEKCMLLKKGAQVFISNASIIPKQYQKDCNGTPVSCTTFTVNVDGYCGKVQFGPKTEAPSSNKISKNKTNKINNSAETKESDEEDYSDFEQEFEF